MSARRRAAALVLAATTGCSLFVDLGGISDEAAGGDGGASTDADGGGTDAVLVRLLTFEDGALVHPSTGADHVDGTPTLETARPLRGAHSARVVAAEGSGVSTFRCDLPPASDLTLRFLLRVAVLPSGSIRIVRIVGGGETSGELELSASGQLGVSAPRASAIRSPALDLDVVYAVQLRQTSTGVLEASVAKDGEPFGAPFGVPAPRAIAAATSVALGQTVASNYGMDITLDDVAIEAR